MITSEDTFSGVSGRSIFYQTWRPEAESRAVLLLAHGAGEHSNRYTGLADYFTAQGYVVIALDHNGHGRSDGVPGHVEDFEDYLSDLRTLHLQTSQRYDGLPIFLVGHSLGGLICSVYLLRHQAEFTGGILSGPAIKTELAPGPLQMMLIRLLSVLTPKLGMLQLDANGVSRDPEVVRDYIADPLVHHGKISVRKLLELFGAMDTVQSRAQELSLPILIMHGAEDAMADVEGSRFLHEHIGSQDKTLKIYPDLFHEIFNEPEKAAVMADMLQWCEARLGFVEQ